MPNMHDRAARAALWQAYLHHGMHAWAPSRHDPHAAQHRHALSRGWLWEPREGALAITPEGLEAIRPFLPHQPDRTDAPAEAAR